MVKADFFASVTRLPTLCQDVKIWVVAGATQAKSRMDDFLPCYNVRAAYETHIEAPSSVVYSSILGCDFSEIWVVRLLMTIRSGRRLPRTRAPRDLYERFQGNGFVILSEVPGEELVIGVAGKLWRSGGERCLNLTATDFVGFSLAGYAKAALNFKVRDESAESTILSTETRIQCLDSAALWKFRLYWSVVGPFSGIIRKALLKRAKIDAESIYASR